MFTLEALAARHGDCLLLHYGTAKDPKLILIDGGPSGVWNRNLRPRLEELREERGVDELPIELVMVSHIDDDHINGILGLTDHLIQLQEEGQPRPFRIRRLWHNSFDDVLGKEADKLFTAGTAAIAAADASGARAELPLDGASEAVIANVPQGRRLRDNRRPLKLADNDPFTGLVAGGDGGLTTVDDFSPLLFTVVGPRTEQVTALREDWKKKVAAGLETKEAKAQAAAFIDKSVYNLSSMILLAAVGNKRMLLTGDGRGDHTLLGLEAAGLVEPKGKLALDLLKVPHHGSDHNVDLDYFQRLPAKHYVMSGDGGFGNPEPDTFALISEARGKAPYTIHLTTPLAEMKDQDRVAKIRQQLAADKKAGKKYKVVERAAGARSVVVAL